MSWFDERAVVEHEERLCRLRATGRPIRKGRRGDTLTFGTQLKLPPIPQPDPEPVYSQPFDVTFWFLWFTLKYYVQHPDNRAVIQITTAPSSKPAGGSIALTTPTIGLIQVTIPPIATRGFPDGIVELHYDIQGKDPGGSIHTLEIGFLLVEPDVTSAIQ